MLAKTIISNLAILTSVISLSYCPAFLLASGVVEMIRDSYECPTWLNPRVFRLGNSSKSEVYRQEQPAVLASIRGMREQRRIFYHWSTLQKERKNSRELCHSNQPSRLSRHYQPPVNKAFHIMIYSGSKLIGSPHDRPFYWFRALRKH